MKDDEIRPAIQRSLGRSTEECFNLHERQGEGKEGKEGEEHPKAYRVEPLQKEKTMSKGKPRHIANTPANESASNGSIGSEDIMRASNIADRPPPTSPHNATASRRSGLPEWEEGRKQEEGMVE